MLEPPTSGGQHGGQLDKVDSEIEDVSSRPSSRPCRLPLPGAVHTPPSEEEPEDWETPSFSGSAIGSARSSKVLASSASAPPSVSGSPNSRPGSPDRPSSRGRAASGSPASSGRGVSRPRLPGIATRDFDPVTEQDCFSPDATATSMGLIRSNPNAISTDSAGATLSFERGGSSKSGAALSQSMSGSHSMGSKNSNSANGSSRRWKPPVTGSTIFNETTSTWGEATAARRSVATQNRRRISANTDPFDASPMYGLDARKSMRKSSIATDVTSTLLEELNGSKHRPRWRWQPRHWAKLSLNSGDALLSNKFFTSMMTLLTVFVLVGDDIRLMCFEADADPTFDGITIVCLFLFFMEMILSCAVKEDYFPGFWFLADLFASASLVFDLSFVSEVLMGQTDIRPDSFSNSQGSNEIQDSDYARASRSSRVGSRIARILRVLRLARIAQLFKPLYKEVWRLAAKFLGASHEDPSGRGRAAAAPGDEAALHLEEELAQQAESRVGKKLSERTPQRVILIVLALLFVLPQLDVGDSIDMMSTSAQFGADVVYQAWANFEIIAASYPSSVDDISLSSPIWNQRWEFEAQTLMYIYHHRNLDNYLNKLCWVGYVRRTNYTQRGPDIFKEAYFRMVGNESVTPDGSQSFGIDTFLSHQSQTVKDHLMKSWDLDCSEGELNMMGVTLAPRISCPRKTLRAQESMWYMPEVRNHQVFLDHFEGNFIFIFDLTSSVKWEAAMGIMQTVLVVIVLAIGALLFSRDVDQLVLLPIERMIGKVNRIRFDPLYAIRLSEADNNTKSNTKATDRPKVVRKANGKRRFGTRDSKPKHTATLETKMLENTIIKLGSLLALGFGEAGVRIIAENLDDDSAQVRAKIPGSKVEAIFGFCDIRHFNVATEVLKEQTMVFVNRVAAIVHEVVDQHAGAPNKNLGQAFLLVWQLSHFAKEYRTKVADLSVMAFIKVVAAVSRDKRLAEIVEHPLLRSRMPDFRVSLGFGLHLGWAIAGGIGSDCKIDASYLSPHVNLAGQLEQATELYDLSILMSEPLVRTCSTPFRRHFRAVDHVQLSGSRIETMLFTVDLQPRILNIDPLPRRTQPSETNSQTRAQRKEQALSPDHQVHLQLYHDKRVRQMRSPYTRDFFQDYERGLLNYFAGEWDVAAPVLEKTRTMLCQTGVSMDGPSKVLYDFMESSGFKPPVGWRGWRSLDSKTS